MNEELHPNKTATVYHRTPKGSVANILKTEFKSATGCHYGCGLYTTFALESQFNSYMDRYGDTILKFVVSDITNYLILQQNIARQYLGNNYKLSDQCKKLGIFDLYTPEQMKGYEEKFNNNLMFGGELGRKMYEDNGDIEKKIKGMIFRGGNDGYVLLKYNPVEDGTIRLVAYAPNAATNDLEKLAELQRGQGWKTFFGGSGLKHRHKMDANQKYQAFGTISTDFDTEGQGAMFTVNGSNVSDLVKRFYTIKGRQPMIQYLNLISKKIKAGHSNITDVDKRFFFEEALKRGLTRVAKVIFDSDPSIFNNKYYSKLATASGDEALIDAVIDKAPVADNDAFNKAIEKRNLDLVKKFVEKGKEVNDHYADAVAKSGSLNMLRYLVSKGLKVNEYLINSLLQYNNYAGFEYLVDKMDPIPNWVLNTIVTNPKNRPAVKYVIEKGGKFDPAVSQYVMKHLPAENDEKIKMLWTLIGSKNQNGNEIAGDAAFSGDLDLVKYLYKYGFKPDARSIVASYGWDRMASDEMTDFFKQINGADIIMNDPEVFDGAYVGSLAVSLSNDKLDTVKKIAQKDNYRPEFGMSAMGALRDEPEDVKAAAKDIFNKADARWEMNRGSRRMSA